MSPVWTLGAGLVAAGVVRQSFVLSAVARSGRFLRTRTEAAGVSSDQDASSITFFLVVPVLREAETLPASVAHLRTLADGAAARIIVVTTAREAAEARAHPGVPDTVKTAADLARRGMCVHLHFPDPRGVKADQLNYAAGWCTRTTSGRVPPDQVFMVCYDADSRPAADSLACFTRAIMTNPAADVFHQSSRFRGERPGTRGFRGRSRAIVREASALRANRFVLGFEIPRLAGRSAQRPAKRAAASLVYAHVTGHGLCVRLSLLQRLPFPARSPLEDMHYSFILNSRGMPAIPVASLDEADVPDTIGGIVGQAARWFAGPARISRYLNDPATCRNWRTWFLAGSAAGSAVEWLGCAIVPALIVVLVALGSAPIRIAAAAYAGICAVQVVLTEARLGAPAPFRRHLARIAAFPLACTLHGIGGFAGAARLPGGRAGAGKTERGAIR